MATATATGTSIATRLHHNAFVTADMEATRHFTKT
jgi:hypothetical protein